MTFNTKEYNEAYYLKHRDRIIEYSRTYRKTHADEISWRRGKAHYTYINRLSGMEKSRLAKVGILSHYSNPQIVPICNNCGEQDIDVLCLDHINGGGSKHSRERRSTLYNWILKNNYPKGFQVLCANCNTRKARLEFFTSQVKPYSGAALAA